MRSLIRRTLLIVARLALVVSVAAWVVGQWRAVEAAARSGRSGLCAFLVREGLVFSVTGPSIPAFEPRVIVTTDIHEIGIVFEPLGAILTSGHGRTLMRWAGQFGQRCHQCLWFDDCRGLKSKL